MAVRSKAQICSRFIAVISGSNPADFRDVHLFFRYFFVWLAPLQQADHSFIESLKSVRV